MFSQNKTDKPDSIFSRKKQEEFMSAESNLTRGSVYF